MSGTYLSGEHWFVCGDCDGTREAAVQVDEDGTTELMDCDCTDGFIEGDADDCALSKCATCSDHSL